VLRYGSYKRVSEAAKRRIRVKVTLGDFLVHDVDPGELKRQLPKPRHSEDGRSSHEFLTIASCMASSEESAAGGALSRNSLPEVENPGAFHVPAEAQPGWGCPTHPVSRIRSGEDLVEAVPVLPWPLPSPQTSRPSCRPATVCWILQAGMRDEAGNHFREM